MNNLFAVVVTNVYPRQCVAVWESEGKAYALSEHLNKEISPHTRVQTVDSFYPSGMVEADSAWLASADRFISGLLKFGGVS